MVGYFPASFVELCEDCGSVDGAARSASSSSTASDPGSPASATGSSVETSTATASADASASAVATADVRFYLKHVGLGAWVDHFERHLPANVKSVELIKATTAADLRRMATKANMRLDFKTTRQVLNALKKKPKLTGAVGVAFWNFSDSTVEVLSLIHI